MRSYEDDIMMALMQYGIVGQELKMCMTLMNIEIDFDTHD